MCQENMMIWKKESKILIEDKYGWYNKKNINLRNRVYQKLVWKIKKSIGLYKTQFVKFWWQFYSWLFDRNK